MSVSFWSDPGEPELESVRVFLLGEHPRPCALGWAR